MSAPAQIRVLPTNVANKIAAGEVVERPASVLKELMENAIDAGATQIDMTIAVGGRKLVGVTDDGAGMTRDDALLCIERHATSKIRDVDDIEQIDTLGFRGEALAAIASVSRFRLRTCRPDDVAGTEIAISGGKLLDVRETGCPPGTCIEVRDLFFNVPARRKFLRSQQTELGHLRGGFLVQALAHPAIGMSFTVDGRETYRLARGASLEDRVRELFGRDYAQNLREVSHRTGEVAVRGYVSLPAVSRADRSEQYLFVNGRSTGAALLNYAIREGYRTLLPGDRHPCVFLFLDLAPTLVDVNVHPTKKEIRFRHPGDVRDAVIAAVRQALEVGASPTPEQPGTENGGAEPLHVPAAADVQLRIDDLPPVRTFRYPRMPMADPHPPGAPTAEPPGAESDTGGIRNPKSEIRNQSAPWSWCRIVGQIGELYVVLEIEDGLVLMDPHAAHERVLFERYMDQVEVGRVESQSMLMPETVELGPKDTLRVRKNLSVFREMGFGISEFGGDAFVVDALPACLSGASAETLLVDVAHGLEIAGARGAKGRWCEESIAQAACKAAVKARERLGVEEIERLVVDLAQTRMPYTCPHGRPTLIFTSFHELNRKFGRE